MESDFFAMVSRMKYIKRWSLMKNSSSENLSEHSLEVSMLAHCLAVISNKRLGNNLNVEKVALIALYHDSTEIITGDMPTPIKYFNKSIQGSYKEIERQAAERLLNMLAEDLRDEYTDLFVPQKEDEYLWKLVKGADKLSALIKCIQEENAGNKEFISAKNSTLELIKELNIEEVNIFMEEFIPSYSKTLDELG
ncbi:MAG TPA: 5'-deoxynucleotidase [Clostridiales bacterium]|nr:5'-deoxynucleotidase [Clostridiales bacterium]